MFKGKRIISFLLVIMMAFSVVGFAAEDVIPEGASEIVEDTDENNIVQEEVEDDEEDSGSFDVNEDEQTDTKEPEEESKDSEEIKAPEIPTNVITGKFNLLKVLGIIEESEDNLFLSDKAVTRAELMMYFAKISGLDKTYEKEYRGSFADVDKKTPYYQSIQAMEFTNVINGNGAGSFFPNDKVTVTDAVCSAVKLLGYDIYALNSGGYPSGYFAAANQAGITKGMEASSDGYLYGKNAVTLLLNVLECELTVQSVWGNEGSIKITNDSSYLEKVFSVYSARGIVNANEMTGLTSRTKNVSYGCVGIDGVVYKAENADRNDMLGKKIDFYYKNNDETTGVSEIIWYEVNKNVEVIELDARDIESVSSHVLKYTTQDDDLETIKFSGATDVIFNYKAYYEYTASEIKIPMGKVTLIDNDNDGIYDVINILSFEEYVVHTVSETDNVIYAEDGTKIILPTSDGHSKIIKDNTEIAITDMYSGMVFNVVRSKDNDYVTVYASDTVVTGGVKEVINDGSKINVNIDGTSYILSVFSKYSPMAGDYGSFYLNSFGEIAAKDRIVNSEQYAYLITLRETGPEVDKKYYFKLLTEAGVETFEAAEKIKFNEYARQSAETVFNLSELYANGRKDADGNPITDENGNPVASQLIKFATDSKGKLNRIITYQDNTTKEEQDPSFKKAYDDDTFTLDHKTEDGGYIRYLGGNAKVFGTRFLVNAKTLIFYIPKVYSTSDEDYKVDYITGLLTETNYYDLEFYNVSYSNHIGAIVNKKDVSGGGDIDNKSADVIVSKVTQYYIEEEGVIGLKISGFSRGNAVELLVKDLNITDSNDSLGYKGKSIATIKPGDIIQYTAGDDGSIGNVRFLYSYTPESYVPYESSDENIAHLYIYLYHGIGELLYRDDMSVVVNCRDANNRKLDRAFNIMSRSHFYRVDTKTGKVSLVEAGDIPQNARVFVRSCAAMLDDIVYYE